MGPGFRRDERNKGGQSDLCAYRSPLACGPRPSCYIRNMSYRVLLLTALLVFHSASANARADDTSNPGPAPACEAAKEMVATLVREGRAPIALDDPFPSQTFRWLKQGSPADFTHHYVTPVQDAPQEASDNAYGWSKDAPSEGLATAFLSGAQATPLTACPAFAEFLKMSGVSTDVRQAERTRRRTHGGPLLYTYKIDIVRLSLPVVSDDGCEALVIVEYTAGGGVWHLRRDETGHWAVADYLPVWVV